MDLTIISGAQTGADSAGLIVAKRIGFKTGGWMPKGFMTSSGPQPAFAAEYGLKEHKESGYKPRTWANVKDSDLTLRLAFNFKSAGEKCTLNAIKYYNKPHIDIDLNNPQPVLEVYSKIIEAKPSIINVAGNSHKTNSMTYTSCILYLTPLFIMLKDYQP